MLWVYWLVWGFFPNFSGNTAAELCSADFLNPVCVCVVNQITLVKLNFASVPSIGCTVKPV